MASAFSIPNESGNPIEELIIKSNGNFSPYNKRILRYVRLNIRNLRACSDFIDSVISKPLKLNNESERAIILLIEVLLELKKTEEARKLLQHFPFSKRHHKALVKMWDESNYIDKKNISNRPLTLSARYRIRQRFLPPRNILPSGIRSTQRFSNEAKKALLDLFEHTPYPTKDQLLALSSDLGLTELQIRNWFACQRRAYRSKHKSVVQCKGIQSTRKITRKTHQKRVARKLSVLGEKSEFHVRDLRVDAFLPDKFGDETPIDKRLNSDNDRQLDCNNTKKSDASDSKQPLQRQHLMEESTLMTPSSPTDPNNQLESAAVVPESERVQSIKEMSVRPAIHQPDGSSDQMGRFDVDFSKVSIEKEAPNSSILTQTEKYVTLPVKALDETNLSVNQQWWDYPKVDPPHEMRETHHESFGNSFTLLTPVKLILINEFNIIPNESASFMFDCDIPSNRQENTTISTSLWPCISADTALESSKETALQELPVFTTDSYPGTSNSPAQDMSTITLSDLNAASQESSSSTKILISSSMEQREFMNDDINQSPATCGIDFGTNCRSHTGSQQSVLSPLFPLSQENDLLNFCYSTEELTNLSEKYEKLLESESDVVDALMLLGASEKF